MKNKNDDVLKELEHIKKLLILQLVRDGATSEEIGLVLGITGARVRQVFPMKKLKESKK